MTGTRKTAQSSSLSFPLRQLNALARPSRPFANQVVLRFPSLRHRPLRMRDDLEVPGGTVEIPPAAAAEMIDLVAALEVESA